MAAATAVETPLEEYKRKRDALLLKSRGLEEVLEAAPSEIAIVRETYYRSESPARKRALDRTIDAQRAAEG
jgi:hypothetical protein